MRDMEKLPGLQIGGKFFWQPVSFTQNLRLHRQAWSWYRRALQGSMERLLNVGPCNLSNQKLPQAMTGARIHTSKSPDSVMFAATMEWVRITEADDSPDPA
jgi:hypothetical protein